MADLNNHMFGVVIIIVSVCSLNGLRIDQYSLFMPNVHPNKPELYLCTPIKINSTNKYYIIGFEPNATMNVVHHMLLYGCTEPGSSKPVWNCGEMSSSDMDEDSGSPCGSGSQIIYAWARDAPKLELPKDVGFEVGGDSPIQYLVLQVHYGHVEKFKDGSTDNSGVILSYTERRMDKLAGVLLLGTSGYIPPMTTEHMETLCEIKENKTIIPFAFRTHAHSLGVVISGYVVTTDENGNNKWTLLGKESPSKPQMFYPTITNTPIRYKDKLAARCTMVSDRRRVTYIGATNEDEMCNYYLMYYSESGDPLKQKYCFTAGPPNFYWDKVAHLNHIPSDASNLY
uniref:peptidylglycine monooxygenase n=1 Tax=Clastoptera arizonana TaxID=38151 RepID=A0A1B6C5R3_9HEMI